MRKILNLSWLLFFILAGVGFYLSNAYTLGFCGRSIFCLTLMNKGEAAFFGFFALGVVSLFLSIFPKTFSSWKKFGIWSVPVLVVLFAITQDTGGEWISLEPPAEVIYLYSSVAFVVVSLSIILGDVFLRRRNSKS